MRAKALKPATIIPRGLYVPRDADRQLHRVLEDMGRPGYVLVARQMGKTNLLLHAKRTLENEQDIFVYLDLSGANRTARECFRAIIDTAVETHPQAFANVAETINNERERRRDLPAHKEHEAELRLLLSTIRGKIVIILDEIDALTRCDYSDQIFSLIRSTYFARVNFPEYSRLTYVLSGVAEPTEIIKNPNLSPFNIGEKIYLDDFTIEEFNTFVNKAGLSLDDDVKAHVFSWTNGNPRITWDICSELEDYLLSGKLIAKETVDAVVEKLYLTAFDRPPVDHIRSLVENDKVIRNAIVQIRYGKGDTLSDAVRNRLYLAGVVKSDIRNIRIKNRIIDASLSDQWVRDVDVRKTGALPSAMELINSSRFSEAIPLVRNYLESTPDDPKGRALAQSYLGLALQKTGEYKEAISHFEAALAFHTKAAYPTVYYEESYQLGLCQFHVGNIDAAIQCLEEVSTGEFSGDYYVPALLTLSSIYLQYQFDNRKDQIFEFNQRVINEIPALESRLGHEIAQKHRTIAHFNLAKYYERLQDKASAERALDDAIADAPAELKPRLILERYRIDQNPETRAKLVLQIIDAAMMPSLEAKPPHPASPLAFDTNTVTAILLLLYTVGPREAFSRLMERVAMRSSNPARTRVEQLRLLAVQALVSERLAASQELISSAFDAVRSQGVVERNSFLEIVRLHAVLNESPEGFEEVLKYFQSPDAPASLSVIDIGAFTRGVSSLQQAGSHLRAIEALSLAIPRLGTNSGDAAILLQHMAMISHHALGNLEEEKRLAEVILKLAPNAKVGTGRPRFLDEKTLSRVVTYAESALHGAAPAGSRIVHRIGRNERVLVKYRDGQEVTDKYKKVEADLKAGRCVLVRSYS